MTIISSPLSSPSKNHDFEVKKLINQVQSVVPDFVEGLLLSDNRLGRIQGYQSVVYLAHLAFSYDKVKIVSGGGSGHEPAHAGYLGDGMLTAAILGNVFASPSVAAILATLRVCASTKGILLVVKNYTGDRINFGMAAERAQAEGILVKMIIVDDDCALSKEKGITGGRGVAGTILVHKVAGAVAATGATLDEVYAAAKGVVDSISTMGVALSTCTVPGASKSDRLDGNIMEIGLGIHGEQGREQAPFPSDNAAKITADILVRSILEQPIYFAGNEVAVLINNLGTVPGIELYIVAREVLLYLAERNMRVVRVYIGSFMTALDMYGVSLTVLKTSPTTLVHLDAGTSSVSWPKINTLCPASLAAQTVPYDAAIKDTKITGGKPSLECYGVAKAICARIIAAEPLLTEYDQICGDGDCGLVMRAGCERILHDIDSSDSFGNIVRKSSSGDATVTDTATFCSLLADSISNSMGGTSGVLLELMMRAMARYLSWNDNNWGKALVAGVEAIQFYGGAKQGMRTMLDAFLPALTMLSAGQGCDAASEAAREGADGTARMNSLAGRSNYLSEEQIRGTPDPGAVAVAEAFQAAAEYVKSKTAK